MLIGNIRSNQDLQSKKELQKQLLELEVANEELRQKKRQELNLPKQGEAQKLPEQYKTTSEIQKDRVNQEKKAIDNFIDLGFNYAEAGQLANWLSVSNRLSDFNSIYKGVKKELFDNYDKSILTPDFIKTYLDNAFDELDTNFGKRFSKDIANAPVGALVSLDSLVENIPSEQQISRLIGFLEQQKGRFVTDTVMLGTIDTVISLVNLYKSLLPDEEIYDNLRRSVSQNDRMRIAKRIMSLLTKAQFLDSKELDKILLELRDQTLPVTILKQILNRLLRQLSYFNTSAKVDNFIQIYEDLIKLSLNNPNVDSEKIRLEVEGKIKKIDESLSAKRAETDLAKEVLKTKKDGAAIIGYYEDIITTLRTTAVNGRADLAKNILNEYAPEYLTEKETQILIDTANNKGVIPSYEELTSILFSACKRRKDDFPDWDPRPEAKDPRQRTRISYDAKKTTGKYGRPEKKNKSLRNNEGLLKGLGADSEVLSKLKKHFKGDEKLLKKVVKTLKDESSSSSESEIEEELQRHKKASAKEDKDLERFVSGVSFKAKRIPVGKVGKGVKLEKEDNPTYRQFGKYVLHIPYLLNSNIANFKYPSLGSIPSIKPLTVSDDYKDLLLDTLQTGKLNKKELERLPQNEIKHFEKVAVGAGLVEQLGMKVGSTEEDKADAKRFEILRGEYLAGNNNEKMIKELRLLISKFINNGRIHKNEGLNLLLELSTI
jgi:hypothetical protein